MTFRYAVMVSENGPFYPNLVRPGWYAFEATPDKLTAAYPINNMRVVVRFLNRLPRFAVIALHQVRATVWLVMPYNRSDVRQRGWAGEPRELHLVRDAILPLDVIWARESGVLLYDRIDDCLLFGNQSAQAISRRLREEAVDDGEIDFAGVSPEMQDAASTYLLQAAQIEEMSSTIEDEIRRRLEFVGAGYVGHRNVGGGYRVDYTLDNQPLWVEIDPSMTVRSFGFCVAGTERQHTLSSAVHVAEDAIARGHIVPGERDDFDMPF